MKVKVIDELGQKRDASIDEVNRIGIDMANSAKQLLLGAATDERDILRAAGLDTNIQEIENARGLNIERERFEGTYGQKVFTEEEVKSICHKYALKLLPTKYYKGGLDPVLASKILEFFKNSKIDSRNYEATQNLYIMAPAKAFNLTKKVNPFRVTLDPVMFYRIHRRNEDPMYVPVHQWGNDFTIFRRVIGAVKFNYWTNLVFGAACKAILALVVFAMFKIDIYNIAPVAWAVVIGTVWHMLYYLFRYGGSEPAPIENSEHKFSENGWNKEFK